MRACVRACVRAYGRREEKNEGGRWRIQIQIAEESEEGDTIEKLEGDVDSLRGDGTRA